MRNINLHPIVKNLLIINVIMFLAVYALKKFNIDFTKLTAMHYIGSVEFSKRPWQLISHMFMHANIPHIFMNMLGLVMFGNVLENVMGSKKFLILFFVAGLGSAFLHSIMQMWEMYNIAGYFITPFDIQYQVSDLLDLGKDVPLNIGIKQKEFEINFLRTAVGASGAIYGIVVAFALFFPNTELYLMFIPVPVKAKYLVPGLLALDLIFGVFSFESDPIAHWAHIGGALAGFILIKIWNKDKSRLY